MVVGGTRLNKRCPVWQCRRYGLTGHNNRGCTYQGVPKSPNPHQKPAPSQRPPREAPRAPIQTVKEMAANQVEIPTSQSQPPILSQEENANVRNQQPAAPLRV